MKSLGIHLRALSPDDVKISINKTRLKIAVLKWHLGLPGAIELSHAEHSISSEIISTIIVICNKGYQLMYSLTSVWLNKHKIIEEKMTYILIHGNKHKFNDIIYFFM